MQYSLVIFGLDRNTAICYTFSRNRLIRRYAIKQKGIVVSAEKKEITHDSLQEQLERTLNILKQRETGWFTWHMALNEALSELSSTLCPLFQKQVYEMSASARLAELKMETFLILNGKMINRYQDQQAERMDDEMFDLFKMATAIRMAKSESELRTVIPDL